MRKSKAKVISLAISLSLLSTVSHHGALGQDQRSVTLKRVVMPTGWKIPGLTESKALSPRHPLAPGYGVQGVPMQITLLKPTREVREQILLYGAKDGGETIIVGQRLAVVRGIIKCELNDRAFLYIVQFGSLVYDSLSKTTDQSGLFGLLYYDNDGDGIFESRESGPLAVTPDLRIPDWVLKNP